MATLLEQVSAFSDRYALLGTGATVVVAVSGGPDSLCLLHLLHGLAPERKLRLHVAHLDHQLRPDSAADAEFVARTAAAWRLPVTLGREDVAAIARERRTGIEATARAVRLRFLVETAQTVGAETIALGHTADDQAETVLLRLLRGAGPSGLGAMRPRRTADVDLLQPEQPPIALVRPLLETTRAQVEAHCAEHHLEPRYDSSNQLPIYLRNRVRDHIIPLLKTYNPSIVATLGRTARVCAEEDDLLNELVERAWQDVAQLQADGILLDRQHFMQLHRALQRRLLRKAAQLLAAQAELEARHIDLILAAIVDGRRRVQLPQKLWLHIRRTTLWLSAETGA
ncbi:MAG TPA: tRNA lysidine(34) synthetase TilS [Herpetosiphonaceae bacterium]